MHGAYGYIISHFLSAGINQRTDSYGGNLENRTRLLFEIIDGIRMTCGQNFILGVRISPERFGMRLSEVKTISTQLADDGKIDFLDISVWDYKKMPEEEEHQNKTLLQHFTDLDLKKVKLTIAGHIRSGKDVQNVLAAGVDFVTIGRSAILNHNFPELVTQNPDFEPIANPVSKAHLAKQGLGEAFITYMKRWQGFVEE